MPRSPSHTVRNSPRSLASLCFQFQRDACALQPRVALLPDHDPVKQVFNAFRDKSASIIRELSVESHAAVWHHYSSPRDDSPLSMGYSNTNSSSPFTRAQPAVDVTEPIVADSSMATEVITPITTAISDGHLIGPATTSKDKLEEETGNVSTPMSSPQRLGKIAGFVSGDKPIFWSEAEMETLLSCIEVALGQALEAKTVNRLSILLSKKTRPQIKAAYQHLQLCGVLPSSWPVTAEDTARCLKAMTTEHSGTASTGSPTQLKKLTHSKHYLFLSLLSIYAF
ncbi:hypothetical protein R3P38DRAFT_2996004 [Favolaschia claudopus]|uniref:Myb-like domain-containing protein n=1 Tax=Favolaschia claudopus TaxID=2862362 RepID=A0AAW0AQQ4_9AGAR